MSVTKKNKLGKEYVYDLSFYEAVDKALHEDRWIQGEDFEDGVYVKIHTDCLYVFDAECLSKGGPFPLQVTRGVTNQKYRVIRTGVLARRED